MIEANDLLARCVGSVENFYSHYWRRKALLSSDTKGFSFNDLLSSEAVLHLTGNHALREPFIRVIHEKHPVPFHQYARREVGSTGNSLELIDPDKLSGLVSNGATIVLQSLEETWPPLGAFCNALALELGAKVHSNAYITPQSSQALSIHQDAHDVLALQVHGSKRWVVYPLSTTEVPTAADHPEVDVVLEPGDVLYVPKGAYHAAATSSESSIHIAVAVVPDTWAEVFQPFLHKSLSDPTFTSDMPLRATLDPADFEVLAKEKFDLLITKLQSGRPKTMDEISDRMPTRVVKRRAPALVEVLQPEPKSPHSTVSVDSL